jgi:hypothetical protein
MQIFLIKFPDGFINGFTDFQEMFIPKWQVTSKIDILGNGIYLKSLKKEIGRWKMKQS